jgi:hypothetical protein
VLGVFGVPAFAAGIVFLSARQVTIGGWLILVSTAYASYAFAGRVPKPWSTFDTRSDRQNEEWRWLKYGTLTFLLFGTLFTLLRKQLFGF